ncbi:MAG: L-threonylcarbamoyladenylate synthase [Chitinophagales bacterium]|jgi:L-threonylcarbamoyladenylate synthase
MTSSSSKAELVARAVHAGGVIAYPTEAVWGLGCDPFNEIAVRRLLVLKSRPETKGLILIADTIEVFEPLLEGITTEQRQKLAESWPGPNTWLVSHGNLLPAWIVGEYSTVAIRVSAHPTVKKLCHAFGGPVVSTSANPSGKPPALDSASVKGYFGEQLDGILEGSVGGAKNPSTIRNLITDQVIRSG